MRHELCPTIIPFLRRLWMWSWPCKSRAYTRKSIISRLASVILRSPPSSAVRSFIRPFVRTWPASAFDGLGSLRGLNGLFYHLYQLSPQPQQLVFHLGFVVVFVLFQFQNPLRFRRFVSYSTAWRARARTPSSFSFFARRFEALGARLRVGEA